MPYPTGVCISVQQSSRIASLRCWRQQDKTEDAAVNANRRNCREGTAFRRQLPASKSFGPLGAPSQFLRRLFQGGYILLA